MSHTSTVGGRARNQRYQQKRERNLVELPIGSSGRMTRRSITPLFQPIAQGETHSTHQKACCAPTLHLQRHEPTDRAPANESCFCSRRHRRQWKDDSGREDGSWEGGTKIHWAMNHTLCEVPGVGRTGRATTNLFSATYIR